MAVKNSKKARRLAVMALAMTAVALPGVASADPSDGGRGGWRGRSEESGRQARPQNEDNGGGWRGRQQAQAAPAPAPQAAPQAQVQWQQRSDRGDRGNRGGWGGNAAPQTAPVPQPAQQSWNGGNRNWDRGQAAPQQLAQQTGNGGNRNWDRGDAARRQQQQQQQAPQPAWRGRTESSGQTWNRDQQQRNWNDGDRRDRDGDRRQRDGNWNRDRNTGGYVQGGTWYGSSNGYDRGSRDWNRRDRDHDGDRDGRGWNRQWRDNSHYNWFSYRSSHPSYYRLGAYYAPYRNYSYRRLSIGFTLDNLFFSQNYWIDNPDYYRLPDVYGPYRWVRYYDDAVLVDIYSGEVVDVIYDFFW